MKKSTKITLTTIVTLLLCIPIIVAIVFAVGVDPNSVSSESLSLVTVTSPEGTMHEFRDKEILSLYSDMTSNSTEIDSAIMSTLGLSETAPYMVTYAEKNRDPLSFSLYLSKDADKCVYVTPDKKYYLINAEVASKLITREEFSINVSSIVLPVVKIGGLSADSTLTPNSYTWTTLDLSGKANTVTGDGGATANALVKFDKSEAGKLRLVFDKNPDNIALTIKDEAGETLFADAFENLEAATLINFSRDKKLFAELAVNWLQKDGSDYYGSATYSIPLLFDIAPSYRIVDTKALPVGEFTILRINDFNDGEMLTVENSIGLPVTIPVYDSGEDNLKLAMIPYGAHLSAGDYSFTLKTVDGHTATATIKVREPRDGEIPEAQTLIVDDAAYPSLSAAFSQEALDSFNKLITELTSKSHNGKLYDGKFEYPTGSSKVYSGAGTFGMKRTVMAKNSAGIVYTSFGNDLLATDGQDIKAANNGKVVFAGSTNLLGNTVIIDHGFGILSYYGNLSSITCAVGDSVQKATTVIGKAGSTGFACALDGASAKQAVMCHYAVSMNGIFVAPKSVYNGIFY